MTPRFHGGAGSTAGHQSSGALMRADKGSLQAGIPRAPSCSSDRERQLHIWGRTPTCIVPCEVRFHPDVAVRRDPLLFQPEAVARTCAEITPLQRRQKLSIVSLGIDRKSVV